VDFGCAQAGEKILKCCEIFLAAKKNSRYASLAFGESNGQRVTVNNL